VHEHVVLPADFAGNATSPVCSTGTEGENDFSVEKTKHGAQFPNKQQGGSLDEC
jgi:hypothetical protein